MGTWKKREKKLLLRVGKGREQVHWKPVLCRGLIEDDVVVLQMRYTRNPQGLQSKFAHKDYTAIMMKNSYM